MTRFSYRERDYAFGQQLLTLRTAIGMTQAGLAEHLGVSRQAVGDWEAGISYPKAERLRAFIILAVQHQAFHVHNETDEIRAFWKAAHQKVLLDETWLTELLARDNPTDTGGIAPSTAPLVTNLSDDPHVDWGDAPEVSNFFGRETELALLTDWLLTQQCRVVSLLGMGGIGKTSLAARLAQRVAPRFERVYWRSLRDALPTSDWLNSAIGFLSDQEVVPPPTDAERFTALLQLLRTRRCLLLLDNFETLFEPVGREGRYRAGVAGYGRLLQVIGDTSHQSCLVLTSREAPAELTILSSDVVRTFHLGGLGTDEARQILGPRQLTGSPQQWAELTARFGGNGLALKIVGERIRELFGGAIGLFLEQSGNAGVIGSIRQLLAEQIDRSSAPEQQVLRVLAVAREPVRLTEILSVLGARNGDEAVLEAVEALRRRSLAERAETPGAVAFTLQSVVLEYLTSRLVDIVVKEIASRQPSLMVEQPLIQAQARDYVRYSQEQLIALPVLVRLCAGSDNILVEQQLMAMLSEWRGQPSTVQSYGPGNVVNLLRLLRGDLCGVDLSFLYLRQTYLAEVDAQDASLVEANLVESILAEGFHFPYAVALSGDGELLAVGTSTGQVWLWRVADRTALWAISGHTGSVWGLAISAGGRLASGGADGTVRLWETSSGQLIATLQGHTGTVIRVGLFADGNLLISGSEDGTARLWDISSGQQIALLQGHTGSVYGAVLSADGSFAVTGGEDGTVRLWETSSGQQVALLQGHTGAVWNVALSGDGRLLVSSGADGTVRLWETSSGLQIALLQGHTGSVYGLALSVDGRLVASSGADGTVRLWETSSRRTLATLLGHVSTVWSVALSADGQLLTSGGTDGTVRLWTTSSTRPIATLQGHTDSVWSIALSGDGRLVGSGSADGKICVWETSSGQPLATLHGHTGAVWSVALSADGQLLVSGGEDGTVRLWETSSGQPLATLHGHTGAVWSVALSADGNLVASGSTDGAVRLWETNSGQSIATLESNAGTIRTVVLSSDGHLLVSGSAEGIVQLWETDTGKLLTTLEEHNGAVWAVSLSGDGQILVTSSAVGTVRLWDTRSGQPLASLKGHKGAVRGLALSSDGRLLVTGSADNTIRLWEPSTGQQIALLQGHIGTVWDLALSADGHLIVSGGADGTVRLWDAVTGHLLRIFRAKRRYEHLDITGLKGITDAQRTALLALGAVDQSAGPVASK